MKSTAFTLAVCLASAALSLAAQDVLTPTNRIDLFNGRDFAGWTFCMRSNADPAKTWTITNGVIHCTGKPAGYVRTRQACRDYKLTVEWRFVKVAPRADNSGVFVHLHLPDQVWPVCIENQGQYQHHGDFIFCGGATCTGHDTPQTRHIKIQGPSNEKPPGEWNTYEIVCRGDSVKNFVNGKLMNEAEGCSITSGAIAVQSEGAEWELRKIYLEPLP